MSQLTFKTLLMSAFIVDFERVSGPKITFVQIFIKFAETESYFRLFWYSSPGYFECFVYGPPCGWDSCWGDIGDGHAGDLPGGHCDHAGDLPDDSHCDTFLGVGKKLERESAHRRVVLLHISGGEVWGSSQKPPLCLGRHHLLCTLLICACLVQVPQSQVNQTCQDSRSWSLSVWIFKWPWGHLGINWLWGHVTTSWMWKYWNRIAFLVIRLYHGS